MWQSEVESDRVWLSWFKPGEKVVEGGRVGLSQGRLW